MIRGMMNGLRRLVLLAVLMPGSLLAQYQMSPPEFGDTYSFPTPEHPEPSAEWLRFLDVALLALALGLAAWLVFRRRSRLGVILLSIGSVVYFGFYRYGCICSVGAIQNVVLCLVDPHYAISLSVIAIFFLPLAATLFFGRIFCSGVCPLGALQDLVVLRPVKVPVKLDNALRWLPYIYLGLAIFFAGWSLKLALGDWQINIGQRFLICEYDPFIPLFRRSGPFYMLATGAIFILSGMFIGRPYCRWLCPYGGILALLSRVSWKNLSITPDKELNCGLCVDACPYGAIRELRADRGLCLSCTRCYECCPRQKRLLAKRAGKRKPAQIQPATSRPWVAVTRTWTGIVSILLVAASSTWLLATYIHAKSILPREEALVESLKKEAMYDASVQDVLQPELNRQHEVGIARRRVYDLGGWIIIISAGIFIAWFTYLRPKQGAGAGAPAPILRILEMPHPKRVKPMTIRERQAQGISGR